MSDVTGPSDPDGAAADTRALLTDAFSRIQEGVAALTDGLSDEVCWYQPDAGANSIAWLLWHLTRVEDDHLADAAGTEQVWPRWRDRFALPFEADATGYAQSVREVAQVQVSADLLAGYQDEVHQATLAYVQGLTSPELERIVDTRWDPPVTASVRLVSVFDDCAKHLGQAEYVLGLAERALR